MSPTNLYLKIHHGRALFITRSPRSVPTYQLLSNLHWLPIHKRINFKVATLTYKVLSTQQPAYLYNLISYHQPSRSLRSSSQSLLQLHYITYLKCAIDLSCLSITLYSAGTIRGR